MRINIREEYIVSFGCLMWCSASEPAQVGIFAKCGNIVRAHVDPQQAVNKRHFLYISAGHVHKISVSSWCTWSWNLIGP